MLMVSCLAGCGTRVVLNEPGYATGIITSIAGMLTDRQSAIT